MRSSERGAALVNVMWVIFLVVLILAAGAALWVTMQEVQHQTKRADRAESDLAAFEQKFEDLQRGLHDLSQVVGFRDEVVGTGSSVEGIRSLIERVREQYPVGMSPETTTLQQIVDVLGSAYADLATRLSEKDSSLKDALARRDEAQRSLGQVTRDKDEQIAKLRNDLQDEQSRAQQQQQDADQRIQGLQTQVDEAQQRAREIEDQAKAREAELVAEVSKRDARLNELNQKLAVLREPNRPDGEVLSVSDKERLAYLNLGAKDMLRRGTRFLVFDWAKGGVPRTKGWVEVREVFESYALAGIVELVDALDPLVPGDQVAAPTFDPNMPRTFVLLGRFPAGFDRAFVKRRLEALGARVDDAVSVRTDFLVLGEKELGEFAPELGDSEDYKLAEVYGVQMLPVQELLNFIKY
ncbi:MAG: hypothetical protein AB1486_27520 [Planctomycetota bacterium]